MSKTYSLDKYMDVEVVREGILIGDLDYVEDHIHIDYELLPKLTDILSEIIEQKKRNETIPPTFTKPLPKYFQPRS